MTVIMTHNEGVKPGVPQETCALLHQTLQLYMTEKISERLLPGRFFASSLDVAETLGATAEREFRIVANVYMLFIGCV